MRRPRVWDELSPDTPYPCLPAESGLLYRVIPGRRGGQVQQCATPSRKHPREGQVWLGPGSGDHPMRRSTARNRLRDRRRGKLVAGEPLAAHAAVEAYRRGVPGPVPPEYPHRKGSSRCEPAHPIWSGYKRDLKAAEEKAAKTRDPWEPGYEDAVGQVLDARNPVYRETARECVRAFEARERSREGMAVESRTRETSRKRAAYVARGGDTGAAEFVDDVLQSVRRGRR